jgi:hypothetical protein
MARSDLVAQPAEEASVRRVLSIDGGGLKGVFPAAFLTCLEEEVDGSIAQYFDLIAGTSTGGIIALGLGLGYSAQQMLDFYKTLGPLVFQKPARWFSRWRVPKYDPAPLKRALDTHFGDRTIGESSVRLLIPSINLVNGEVYLFKTSHDERIQRDHRQKAAEAALATAAAPTYFPAHRDAKGLPFVDGGLWANNPVACAAVEAVALLGWTDVRILSLGCTEAPLATNIGDSGGLLHWATKLRDVMFRGQSSGALGMAQHLVGHENVARISPTVAPGRYGLDHIDDSLAGLAASEARKAMPHLTKTFLEPGHASRFTPTWPKHP